MTPRRPERPRALAAVASLLLLAAAPGPSLDDARELHADGRLDEALVAYRAVASRDAAADPEGAAIARNNACVILSDRGEYRAAREECEQALALRRSVGDAPRTARTLNNLGLVLQHLGDPAGAERAYREALAINQRAGDAESQAINLSNLGLLADDTGRYGDALAELARAQAVATAHAGEPWSAEQRRVARINTGVVLEKLGAWREALDLYKAVAAEKAEMDARTWATVEVDRGVMLRNLGDPLAAEAAFASAATTLARAGDLAGHANALVNLGLVRHHDLHRAAAAEASYREAVTLAARGGDRGEEAAARTFLAELLLDSGRLDEAREGFASALATARASGAVDTEIDALYGTARLAEARGDAEAALTAFQEAIALVERARAGIGAAASRAGYLATRRAVYAGAVRLMARLDAARPGQGWAARAWSVAQRAKARDLLEALDGGGRVPAPAQPEAVAARIAGRAFLELFVADDAVYGWSFSDDGSLRLARLGGRDALLADVAAFHRGLRDGEPDEAAGDRLARALAPLLGGSARPLVVAPDGGFHLLPFEALPVAAGVRLIDRRAVSYVPSGSFLTREPDRRTAPGRALLGFGDPRLAPGDSALLDLTLAHHRAPPLPGARGELAAVGRRLGGESTILAGAAASEAAFRREAPRGAGWLHLATHAFADEEAGGGGAVLLAAGEGEDGVLRPAEIASLRIPVRLTVLAACRTAGGLGDGRALSSLAGAFLVAGSRSVLATLWEVDDAAAAVFLDRFAAHVGRGEGAAEALRAAKEELRRDPRWDRPALWAPWVLIGDAGDAGARSRAPGTTTFAVIGVAVALLAGSWLLGLRGRRARTRR